MKWTFYPASEFELHAASWDALNACGSNSPLLSSCFLHLALQDFGSDCKKLAILGQPDRPDAMCVLDRRNALCWSTFQPSQAPMGFWLMRSGVELEGALTSLLRELPGFALSVSVTQQDPQLILRPPDSERMLSIDYIDTGFVSLSGDYASYIKSRSSHFRKDLRNMRNRLEQDGLSCQIKRIDDPDEVRLAVENFSRMECSGWKGEQGTAVRTDSEQGRFYLDVLQAFCKSGKGWINCLSLNDKVAAIDLCIQSEGVIYCLKTSYDQHFRKYSPGMLLHLDWFCSAWQLGYKRIEFYGRITDWQQHLTQDVRTIYHLNVFRWSWLARMWKVKRRLFDANGPSGNVDRCKKR